MQTRKAREYTKWHKTASVQRKWNKYYLSRFLDYLAKRDRKFRRYNYPTYNIKVKRKVVETRLALGQELPYSLMMHCATLSCSPSRPISYHNWQRCCKLLNQSCFICCNFHNLCAPWVYNNLTTVMTNIITDKGTDHTKTTVDLLSLTRWIRTVRFCKYYKWCTESNVIDISIQWGRSFLCNRQHVCALSMLVAWRMVLEEIFI